MSKPAFYLGRMIDLNGDEHISSPASPRLHYNPDDPITHAGVVGMTGSGKTGLLIDLLEEAALSGLPSIVIDPRALDTQRLPDARFASMPAWLANPKSFSAAQKAFAEKRWRIYVRKLTSKSTQRSRTASRMNTKTCKLRKRIFTSRSRPGLGAGLPAPILEALGI